MSVNLVRSTTLFAALVAIVACMPLGFADPGTGSPLLPPAEETAEEPSAEQVDADEPATSDASDKAPSDEPAAEQDEAAADRDGDDDNAGEPAPASDELVDLFAAQEQGSIEVKFVAKNDHEGRILITNKLPHGVNVRIPDAFVGVPVVAQFGGGGGGQFGGGGGGGQFGGGGGQQQVGGGGGGLGGGGGGGFGGGGAFSIPPERVTKIDVPLLCLDHGKTAPSSSKPYELRPVDPSVDRPEVIELLKAFGEGQLQHNAAQAAVWHLNSEVSWDELAAKLTGTRRNISRSPYFSRFELQAAYAYAAEAVRRGTMAAEEAAGKSYNE